jgi:tetratricopeptide (TPR) repeat protein
MIDEKFIDELLRAPDIQSRRVLLDTHFEFVNIETVYNLKERADRLERDDAHMALNISRAAQEIAELLSNDEARAVALWTEANAHDLLSELETAVRCYNRAADLFAAAGKPLAAARTSIGLMFTLMKMGQFDQVQTLAESAREVFVAHEDVLSQAKVDMNLGNMQYRQGEYQQALANFRQATLAFRSLGNDLYAAMNQVNEANTLTMLDDFLEAERLHELVRPVFEAADLRTVAASEDHDIAFLKSARGDYSESFRTFERARDIFTSLSDEVNLALTDLEESDLYLDLNLPQEALRLAERAEMAFSKMGMDFELARGRANHAVALARMGQITNATTMLKEARNLFVTQDNKAWVAHTDLQCAEVIGHGDQREPARLLARDAARAYEKLGMKTKQAYAHIISANLWLEDREWDRAAQELQAAQKALKDLAVPWLEHRIESAMGRIHEGEGRRTEAIESYRKATVKIEQLAASLSAEEHRTAYVADKLAPYEALVTLYGADDPSSAFLYAEQAKSRALIDLLAAGIRPRLRINDESDARQADHLQEIRDELNWLYTRITRGVVPGESGIPVAGPETWTKIQECEKEATSLWRDLQARHSEQLSLIRVAALSAEEIQSNLPAGTALVEYFIARGRVTVFTITRENIRAFPDITALATLLPLMENLAFQFSKFQYGHAYYQRHRSALLNATQEILTQLGNNLIAPILNELSAVDAVIIIPHGPLHTLPFHALRVDDHYLIEKYSVSYAPSAMVLNYCWNKSSSHSQQLQSLGRPLLIGVPDERSLHVTDEIKALARLFPDADVLLEDQATFDQVNQAAPECGMFHLAAHGLFRPEAPLLSSIHLADRWLAVQDVYDLKLKPILVTLSACETGLGHDAGGDDLVGLVRGFLYAGACSLVVSLWVVDDESMTQLVKTFYTRCLAGSAKAMALREAQLELIKTYEHPYYWAPLVLVGNQQ